MTLLTTLTRSHVPEIQRGGEAADKAFRLHCFNRDNTNGGPMTYYRLFSW